MGAYVLFDSNRLWRSSGTAALNLSNVERLTKNMLFTRSLNIQELMLLRASISFTTSGLVISMSTFFGSCRNLLSAYRCRGLPQLPSNRVVGCFFMALHSVYSWNIQAILATRYVAFA